MQVMQGCFLPTQVQLECDACWQCSVEAEIANSCHAVLLKLLSAQEMGCEDGSDRSFDCSDDPYAARPKSWQVSRFFFFTDAYHAVRFPGMEAAEARVLLPRAWIGLPFRPSPRPGALPESRFRSCQGAFPIS